MIYLGLMIFLTALYVFLIAPGRKPREKGAEFLGLNYAHRGLHTRDGSVPENSLAAFAAAADAGYAAELDVQITEDGYPAVFHDEALRRMTGDRRKLTDLNLEKLQKLRLVGTEEPVPLLEDVLKTVRGRVPLMVEIKYSKDPARAAGKTYEVMRDYDGLWCVESFDPRVLKWFRKHAPEVWRGQLVTRRKNMIGLVPSPLPFLLANVMFNFMGRPHFIAHSKGGTSISVRMCEFFGAAPMVWTVDDSDDRKWYEYRNLCVIFEYYTPLPRFRHKKGEKG